MVSAKEAFYPIVGIQDGCDQDKKDPLRRVQVRMEIDDWYTSPQPIYANQRALFFPAFWEFQQMSPHDKLSWYQIAGIHGKPFISWDEPPQKGENKDKGYCTHNSILFATWHRPYLLLWEQVIYHLMEKELLKYPKADQPELYEALHTWRFPYWDWALKKPVPNIPGQRNYTVPLIFAESEKTVVIRQPNALGYGEVPNAFYQFTMPGNINMGHSSLKDPEDPKNPNPRKDLRITASYIEETNKDGDITDTYTIPFQACKATSRHAVGAGVNAYWVDGKQNNNLIEKELRDYAWDPKNNTEDPKKGNLTASLRDAFYRLLTIDLFEDFATKRLPGHDASNPLRKEFGFASAENLHDNMHGWCGGDTTNEKDELNNVRLMGHMSHVPLAAFDPIFWAHHSNVDRLIAIWQVLHEDSWFDGSDPRDSDGGTFAIVRGHADKPTDELRPFHKDAEGNYWTSNDAREVTALGYTYPGLEKWLHVKDGQYSKEEHKKAICKMLNNNYNSAWAAAEKAKLSEGGIELMSLPKMQAVANQEVTDLSIDDYVVNVVYEKFALGGNNFIVHIFVGKVPDSLPYDFQEPGTQVGQVINFSTEPGGLGNSTAGCQNCRQQIVENTESSGRVILTNALITRWKNQIPHENGGNGPSTLASMSPEHVIQFLKYNLHWRVTSLGEEIDLSRLPSLKVSLAVGKAYHYVDRTKLSEFKEYKAAYEITQGRPGGAGPEHGLYPADAVYNTEG